jgi:uncharacterized protein YcbK (DUF882 family)
VKVSDNFHRSEFMCKCRKCGRDAVDVELIELLEEIHFHFMLKNIPTRIYIEIISGNRCEAHNSAVGGAPASQHLLGKAADIKVWSIWHEVQISPNSVADFIDKTYPERYGVGMYDGFTHVDVREKKSRWDLRAGK